VKFHDGQELTSADVRFSFDRLLDKSAGGKADFTAVAKVEPAGKYQVRFVTKEPFAALLAALAGFWGYIVSEAGVTKGGGDAAARVGLERPTYEDALPFGITHPDVQREGPVVFLHDPWFGYFGRRDVVCLWTNADRRELGLEGFDARWSPRYRFAFVCPPVSGRASSEDGA
jgi:hypothetical protein